MTRSAADILGHAGPIAAHLGPAFEARTEQGAMARAVEDAFAARAHLLVEAGTGVGKSYAYLVPAIRRCLEHNEKVVVATNTIALQEQLVEHDIPLLIALLCPPPAEPDQPPPVRTVLVKGRGNYLSVRRLMLASQRQDRLFADAGARRSLHVIEDWATTTRDGTLRTLPPLERPGVWDKVQSDSGNCMGRKCPTYTQCFYQAARAQVEHANLFITNHALFFADLQLRSQDAGILPDYDHVVLDEGHGVEDAASDHFGVHLSEGRVAHLLSSLHAPRAGKGYLAHASLAVGDAGRVASAVRAVDDALDASRAFFDSLRRLTGASNDPWTARGPRGPSAGGPDDPRSVRLREPHAVDNHLTPAMRELALRLKSLREGVSADEDRYELNGYAIRAELIAEHADTLVTQSLPGYAYWAEVGSSSDDGPRAARVTFACAPIEVGPLLRDRLFRANTSVVVTSATLATRGSGAEERTAADAFTHVRARLGCDGAACLQLGSPFDFARQMEVHLGAPADRHADDPARDPLSVLSRDVLYHVRATEGGAFVLFTSFAALRRCAAEITPILAREGYDVLAQGRDGSRTEILARFRAGPRAVLLGAASFWQGVDVRGRALRNVIITKLPFEPPDRPITQARAELIAARGGNAFMEDALPRALIRFKQGLGRLIRSATDRGRVVVLDDRVATARYGRLFLAALPEGTRLVRYGPDGEIESRIGE